MNSIEAESVAIIFGMDAREKIMELAVSMPVWAVESTANVKAVDDARQHSQFPLTIFFVRSGESVMHMCSRVLFDVAEHHQCENFDLYGASDGDVDTGVLAELNIRRVRKTEYGCQLTR